MEEGMEELPLLLIAISNHWEKSPLEVNGN